MFGYLRRICLITVLAAISSTAVLHSEPNYLVQNIENVKIQLTIEGIQVAMHFAKGTFGQLSSRVFQIVVENEHEACQLAKIANPDLPCSFELESSRGHEQTNAFVSRNTTAQQRNMKRYTPLSTIDTEPRHSQDLALAAPEALLGVTTRLREQVLPMVARSQRKTLMLHKLAEKGMQQGDTVAVRDSAKQEYYPPTSNMNRIQRDLRPSTSASPLTTPCPPTVASTNEQADNQPPKEHHATQEVGS
jgi:hypothetical protein